MKRDKDYLLARKEVISRAVKLTVGSAVTFTVKKGHVTAFRTALQRKVDEYNLAKREQRTYSVQQTQGDKNVYSIMRVA